MVLTVGGIFRSVLKGASNKVKQTVKKKLITEVTEIRKLFPNPKDFAKYIVSTNQLSHQILKNTTTKEFREVKKVIKDITNIDIKFKKPAKNSKSQRKGQTKISSEENDLIETTSLDYIQSIFSSDKRAKIEEVKYKNKIIEDIANSALDKKGKDRFINWVKSKDMDSIEKKISSYYTRYQNPVGKLPEGFEEI